MSVARHATLADALRHWARCAPDAIAFRFLTELGARVEELSFAALDLEARRIAARVLEVAEPADRAVLVCTSESMFVRAFFGSLFAGVVPVPAAPPPPHGKGGRLAALIADCRPAVAMTETGNLEIVRRRLGADGGGIDGPQWLDVAPSAGSDPGSSDVFAPRGNGTALIQYTSGSTASPRGVLITHDNMIANCAAMLETCGIPQSELRPLAWLPLFHDMGLMGHVVLPAYFGATSTLMPAYDFLQQPASWLRALSNYGATFSLAPNFAYDLCVDRVSGREEEGLDLSAWRCAGNGSEPVRRNTVERFAARFSRCGFDPASFFPSYGLAEATLLVSGGPKKAPFATCRASRAALAQNRVVEIEGQSGEPAIDVVSSGVVRSDTIARIVDPDSRKALPDMTVGEIWVRGPSVAAGYWGRPDETRQVFEAVCADGKERYLRTGDIGFFRKERLFVCGRLKDVVVINGKNHGAEDLELSMDGCHPALAKSGAAVFSVEADERETLIAVCEIRRTAMRDLDDASVIAAMRGAIAEEHGLRLHDAVLVCPGSLPKTTSGKVMRRECRRLYLEGRLAILRGGTK